MIYIGIDNGVTGSIGIVNDEYKEFHHMPIKRELSYTKEKQFINRIDCDALQEILHKFHLLVGMVAIERPMVNPTRFKATQSALRALEAVLIVVEMLEMPYRYIDSKEWQKVLLPQGLKGDELKKASLDIGKRLFPQFAVRYKKDADGILIAEYIRRNKGVEMSDYK